MKYFKHLKAARNRHHSSLEYFKHHEVCVCVCYRKDWCSWTALRRRYNFRNTTEEEKPSFYKQGEKIGAHGQRSVEDTISGTQQKKRSQVSTNTTEEEKPSFYNQQILMVLSQKQFNIE